MLIDSHVHLQPHYEQPPVDRARIETYVEAAHANGVDVVVFTEHLFRFREAYELLDGWWDADPDPRLAALTRDYWLDHVNLSLAEYVRLIEEAKSDGLPVRLGLEMDWIPGRAQDLRALLAPYAWDCVLGSVHWIGAFGLDMERFLDEWKRRELSQVWDEYGQFMEDLADSRLVDVLAHADLAKVWGFVPADASKLHTRLVAAARRNGLALEVNANGLNKPVGQLYPHPAMLRAARDAGVAITLASDGHYADKVGQRFDEVLAAAREAGYSDYVALVGRERQTISLP